MTTGPGTGRVSTSETLRRSFDIMEAQATRTPSPPECVVESTTTTLRPAGEKAYRVHNWTVTIRGTDADECNRTRRRIDAELQAEYAHELDTDTLGAQLAASVIKKDKP